MRKINVCAGADCAAYSNFTMEVPDGLSEEAVRERIKTETERRDENGELIYDPEFDFHERRVVTASDAETGDTLLEGEPLEPGHHTLGVEARRFLSGQITFDEFVEEGRKQGITPVADLRGPSPA